MPGRDLAVPVVEAHPVLEQAVDHRRHIGRLERAAHIAMAHRVAAPAVIGALLEGLLGPLAPHAENAREAVRAMTLFALRALGVVDARARGLVAQCPLP